MGSRAACLAVVPSRGRPAQLREMLEAFGTASVCSDLFLCLDDDDPQAGGYRDMLRSCPFTRGHVYVRVGPRQSLAGWTNAIAAEHAPLHEALITLGDDHRPETKAFDRRWLEAARAMGGGWAYGDDGISHQEIPAGWHTSQLPSAFLVSSVIVQALGWMMLPGCEHMLVDAAARDLALAVPALGYLPDVKVPHLHYSAGLSAYDQTYAESRAATAADDAVYRAWLGDPPGTGQIARHAETVRRALERS